MGSAGTSKGHHALIYGASGITGWAIVNQLLSNYPDANTFSKVTALTNRPLSLEAAQWPASEKLEVVNGLDLLRGSQNDLEVSMKQKIADIHSVTHIYFFAYIMDPNPEEESLINVNLLRRGVEAVDHLSANLRFVVLPTGTKAYGVHLIDEFPWKNDLPLSESLPRIPEPYASQNFYYAQLDLLKSMSANKSWTYCDIIPDVVVGFVPNNNVYCLAQTLALYLSLVRKINGEGATVVFPGTMQSWSIKSNDSSQDIIARFAIHASLHPAVSGGQSFNAADNSVPSSWSKKWPVICEYFGLRGVAPSEDSGPDPYNYVIDHRDQWAALEKEHNLQTGRVGNERSFGGFPYFIMTMFNFDRQLNLKKMHEAWGKEVEETDAKGAWWTAFDRFRKAKIIPWEHDTHQ